MFGCRRGNRADAVKQDGTWLGGRCTSTCKYLLDYYNLINSQNTAGKKLCRNVNEASWVCSSKNLLKGLLKKNSRQQQKHEQFSSMQKIKKCSLLCFTLIDFVLTLCIIMDSSLWFGTINLRWSIVYI